MSKVQVHFENDEVVDIGSRNISVGCEKCGQLFHISTSSADEARKALKELDNHKTKFHTEGTQS